ncbi:MAG: adenylosuccinate synthase [Sandaracinaceae bacterium]
MSTVVIVGAQWGDEGKGKVVDLLTAQADAVVRFGGGANAGHTLVVEGDTVVFHLVPSGALHDKPRLFLGPGMVLDPKVLADELATMAARGLLREGRVLVSDRAHLVLPHHFVIDGEREKGPSAIGTTLRGIGPAYQDRASRRGLRVADLADPDAFRVKVRANLEAWAPFLLARGHELAALEAAGEAYLAYAEQVLPHAGDVTEALHAARRAGQRILLEGAQGTMLDLDHGTYPYVTSSSVTAGGACTGSGLPPTAIDRVLGITKAYTTRVGDGPFPTELSGDEGDALRRRGSEFGATTGRPRRCGWLDIPVLRWAVHVNGLSELARTKLDVLSGLDRLRLAVAYDVDGTRREPPPSVGLDRARPVYEELPGFDGDLTRCRTVDDLPAAARAYVARIEELLDVPVSLLRLGPERSETIVVADPWR